MAIAGLARGTASSFLLAKNIPTRRKIQDGSNEQVPSVEILKITAGSVLLPKLKVDAKFSPTKRLRRDTGEGPGSTAISTKTALKQMTDCVEACGPNETNSS